MLPTLPELGWPELLDHLSACARTPAGARACAGVELSADPALIRARYAEVAEVLALEADGERVPVGGVGDVAVAVDHASRGTTLDGPELRRVGATLEGLRWLRKWLGERAEDAPRLWARAVGIEVDEELVELLARSFDPTGQLSGAEYPELDRLRRAVDSLRGRLQSTLDHLLRDEALGDMLQDRYVTERNGRFVLPVKASYRRGLGIVHGTSHSGETVYVEPTAVVEVHNDLREAEAARDHEERRILAELSRKVGGRRRGILESLDAAVTLDVACARAGLGRKLDGTLPSVQAEGVLVVPGARHPLLVLGGVPVVPNDLALTPQAPGLVLTGPNAGGKTIALKTIGLCALMVRAALPLPGAEGARCDVFDPVLADIGDLQSVVDGLSTFSAHVKGLGEALDGARPGALVLVDEITAGTDPAQGAALARAVLEELLTRGARVAVTTHFPELKTLASVDPRFAVAAAEFRDGRPTFRIQTGVPGPSHALAIARRMGLPEPVLRRAAEVMDQNVRDLAETLEKLEAERSRVAGLEAELSERERQLRRREQKLGEQEARLAAQGRRQVEEATEKHKERLKKAEEEVRALVAALQANPDLKTANTALQTIRASRLPPPEPVAAAPVADLKPGDLVKLRALGQIVKVRTVAGDGRVELEVGKLRTWAHLDDLDRPSGPEKKAERRKDAKESEDAAAPKGGARDGGARKEEGRRDEVDERLGRRGGGDGVPRGVGVPVDYNTCDLRGLRVDEAQRRTEDFFDRRQLDGLRLVFVLHGHGTGALKTAIREWLPRSRYVRGFRPADADEGGDAFTVVELR